LPKLDVKCGMLAKTATDELSPIARRVRSGVLRDLESKRRRSGGFDLSILNSSHHLIPRGVQACSGPIGLDEISRRIKTLAHEDSELTATRREVLEFCRQRRLRVAPMAAGARFSCGRRVGSGPSRMAGSKTAVRKGSVANREGQTKQDTQSYPGHAPDRSHAVPPFQRLGYPTPSRRCRPVEASS